MRTVILYIGFPLLPQNVDKLLCESGMDLGRETIRFLCNRFLTGVSEVDASKLDQPDARLLEFAVTVRIVGGIWDAAFGLHQPSSAFSCGKNPCRA